MPLYLHNLIPKYIVCVLLSVTASTWSLVWSHNKKSSMCDCYVWITKNCTVYICPARAVERPTPPLTTENFAKNDFLFVKNHLNSLFFYGRFFCETPCIRVSPPPPPTFSSHAFSFSVSRFFTARAVSARFNLPVRTGHCEMITLPVLNEKAVSGAKKYSIISVPACNNFH
jgi:hypothetical protein